MVNTSNTISIRFNSHQLNVNRTVKTLISFHFIFISLSPIFQFSPEFSSSFVCPYWISMEKFILNCHHPTVTILAFMFNPSIQPSPVSIQSTFKHEKKNNSSCLNQTWKSELYWIWLCLHWVNPRISWVNTVRTGYRTDAYITVLYTVCSRKDGD